MTSWNQGKFSFILGPEPSINKKETPKNYSKNIKEKYSTKINLTLIYKSLISTKNKTIWTSKPLPKTHPNKNNHRKSLIQMKKMKTKKETLTQLVNKMEALKDKMISMWMIFQLMAKQANKNLAK